MLLRSLSINSLTVSGVSRTVRVAIYCLGLTWFSGYLHWAHATSSNAVLPAGMTFIRSAEGIDEYRLRNGLQILLIPDASKPTTTVSITYRVGSRHESYGETGMAHLLEHLMFKGSKAHPRLWEELSQHGVDFNGTTAQDRTNYYETFAANPDTLAWAISMEADRMVHSRIAADDLKTEFSVVRNEMESNENSSFTILTQRVVAAAHQWHNYGKDTIGARTDVENVNIQRLQTFWRKYYQPDNAHLVVAGAFDAPATLRLIARHFGQIPRPQRKLEATYTLDPVQDGERDVVVRRVGDAQTVMALYHGVPAAHPDYAAIEALSLILGDTPNGRLYHALIDSKKAVDVFASSANLAEPGYFILGADLRTEQNLPEVKKILLDTIEQLAQTPITAAELDRVKTRLLNDLEQTFNDAEHFAVTLSDSISSGDWRLYFLFRDRVKALTVADVQRVATTWLKPSNRTTGSFIPDAKPDRVPAPGKVDVAAELKSYHSGAALPVAEKFVVTPENIDRRTQSGVLSNGLKYALLPKTTRGSTVVLRLDLDMGDEKNLQGKGLVPSLVANMLARGTTSLSHKEFADTLSRLKSTIQISGNPSGVSVSIETVKDSLPAVLQLLHDTLRMPAFQPEEFELLVTSTLAQLEEARSDPQSVALDLAYQTLESWPTDDPRAYHTTEQQIALLKQAKLDDLKQFWQTFYGANHAQFALVGEFDPYTVVTQLEHYFGDWYSQAHYQRLPRPFMPTVTKSSAKALMAQIITPDKANAFFFAGMNLPISDQHPDYVALWVGNYLLGGNPNSRIMERIRQKDGVSYGGNSVFNASPVEEEASFTISAIFAPQNRQKLETGIREELQRAIHQGFTAKELTSAKQSLLQELALGRSQDGVLAQSLIRNLYLNRDMRFTIELEKKLQALTLQQIKNAMAKYLDYDQLVTVSAGDFKQEK